MVIGALDRQAALPLATMLRGEGAIVLVAEGDRACLRVATSVGPDIVLLDPRLSRGLLNLLRAHPFSNGAQISWSRTLASVPATVATPGPDPHVSWPDYGAQTGETGPTQRWIDRPTAPGTFNSAPSATRRRT